MKVHRLDRKQRVNRPLDAVFAFFANPCNLDQLTPSWLHFRMLTPAPIEMRVGRQIEYVIRWRGLPIRWLTEIEDWVPGQLFVDRQIRGPYRLWHHTHSFREEGAVTIVHDVVRYALPAGLAGAAVHRLIVRRDLDRIFEFRARRISELLDCTAGDQSHEAAPQVQMV